MDTQEHEYLPVYRLSCIFYWGDLRSELIWMNILIRFDINGVLGLNEGQENENKGSS